VEFRILGPLEAWDDGRQLDLGPAQQRAVLALLVLHRGAIASADRLVDDLWGERPPASAVKVVQNYISQLRRVLPPDTIVTRDSGYSLRAAGTDADEFVGLLDDARRQDGRTAAATLRRALALWRGPPLADFAYQAWAQAEIARLDDLRLAALEERIDADLSLGKADELVPELEALTNQHPLRERLRAQLMLALYRSGRQADALSVFAQGRERLVDDLGIEPGPELQELLRRILAHDPGLGPAAPRRELVVVERRARWLVVAGALLAAAAIAAVLLIGGGSGPHRLANSLTLVDDRDGTIASQAAVGSVPSQIAVGAGGVWVLNSADNTVTRVDPRSGKAVATFAVGSSPVALVASANALWVGNAAASAASAVEGTMLPATLTEFDPVSRTATRTIALPHAFVSNVLYGRLPGQHELVVGGGSLWAIGEDGHVVRIDPQSGRTRRLPVTADSLAFGAGELWIDQAGAQVLRLDPGTNSVDFSYPLPAGPGISYGFGAAWIADPVQGLVWRLTAGPTVRIRSIPVAEGTTAVAASPRGVWASSVFGNEAVRIDPNTNRVTVSIRLIAPQDVAAAPAGVWVTTGAPPPTAGSLPQSSCGPLVYAGPGKPQFIVASDLALDNPAGTSARPMAAAIEASIRERGFRAGRYRIGYQSCDDSTTQSGGFDWARCVTNARAFSSDPEVIGVVGPYNSACAFVEIPILERAPNGPLALVSPSNTAGNLTISSLTATPGYVLYPDRVRNYARVIAPEQIQYAADAVLEHRLGATRVAVVDGGDPYALQSDRWFSYAAKRLHLKVVRIPWNEKHPNPATVVKLVQTSDANGVFVAAGGLPTAAPIVAALNTHVEKHVPIVVTDWFFPLPTFRQLAHGNIDGVYISNPGEPNSSLSPASRRFVSRVGSSLSYTTAYGGAAAEVLLNAIARSNGTRRSVARELLPSRVPNGILGNLAINASGDPVTAAVTILRLRTGAHNNLGASDYNGAIVSQVITPPPDTIQSR
jgi:DNA-binding SARP family transcriptional activator/ABC-type branched-subunit amino acid transport system substrate-binding protein